MVEPVDYIGDFRAKAIEFRRYDGPTLQSLVFLDQC